MGGRRAEGGGAGRKVPGVQAAVGQCQRHGGQWALACSRRTVWPQPAGGLRAGGRWWAGGRAGRTAFAGHNYCAFSLATTTLNRAQGSIEAFRGVKLAVRLSSPLGSKAMATMKPSNFRYVGHY